MRYQLPQWMTEAACLGMDSDLFFPEPYSDQRTGELQPVELAPKVVCFTCPVKKECLDFMYATEAVHGVQDGVWGGTLLRERRAFAGLDTDDRVVLLLEMVEQQARFLSDRCDLDEAQQLALRV